MPTYEYECKKCSHNFEVFQAMSDEPLKECPKCKKELRRLINGGAGVIFKGSGFYVTDKPSGKASRTESKSEKQPDTNAVAGPACSGGTGESPCNGCPKNKAGSDIKSA